MNTYSFEKEFRPFLEGLQPFRTGFAGERFGLKGFGTGMLAFASWAGPDDDGIAYQLSVAEGDYQAQPLKVPVDGGYYLTTWVDLLKNPPEDFNPNILCSLTFGSINLVAMNETLNHPSPPRYDVAIFHKWKLNQPGMERPGLVRVANPNSFTLMKMSFSKPVEE